jgi:hypothetical protein
VAGVSRLKFGLAGALIVALLALPAGAMAATGSIAGTVTAASGGAPVASDQVCARGTNSSFNQSCTVAGPGGEYTISNLNAGEYRVRFEGHGEYLGQWFDGVTAESQAALVTVTGGATREEVDAQLALGAAVEGTVTDAISGAGAEGVQVCAVTVSSGPVGLSTCATSGAGGHYRVVGLPTGEYKVRFEPAYGSPNPDYLTQYYPDAPSVAEGQPLSLVAGQTRSGVDAAMRLGGTISGTVRDAEGHPLAGVDACVYPVLGNTNSSYCGGHQAKSGADGTYTIHALASGEYKVSFTAIGGLGPSDILPQFYPGRAARSEAGAVVVTAPEAVVGIDATMRTGGSITGNVVEAGTRSPIQGASVCAFRAAGAKHFCTQAKADGTYAIEALTGGDYLVEFASPNSSTDWPFVPTYSGGSSDVAGATPVAVVTGSATSSVNATVARGGTISGVVSDATSGDPAEGIQVCAFASGEPAGTCDTTHASGEYTIVGLPTGSYAVRAVPAGGGPLEDFLIGDKHYMPEYFGEAASEATAALVPSAPGSAATGKDIAMHEGGGISGTVTGPLGEPLGSVGACVVESGNEFGSRCATSATDGTYEIDGLRPGSYKVRFSAYGLQSFELSAQYYDGVLNFGEATPVPVSGTAVTPGIDAQIRPGGKIEGTVTDAYDGTPLNDVRVCAESVTELGGDCAETGADGHYSMPVGAGSYIVKFSLDYDDVVDGELVEVEEFRTRFFAGAATESAATAVTVGSGATSAGIDASLEPAPGRTDSVTVAKAGSGDGAVTSSPAGIACGATCSEDFETRKTVTLQAEPAPGSSFTGWTGACSGTGPCQIRLTAAADVAATFQSTGEAPPATATGPSTTVSPPIPPPATVLHPVTKPAPTCKKGFLRKRVGKTVRCVKKPKAHHPRRHRGRKGRRH